MKKIFFSAVLIIMMIFTSGCVWSGDQKKDVKNNEQQETELTLYVYDSLASSWGLLPTFLSDFEKEKSVKIKVVEFTDTGAMLNQLILEKNNPKADLVMGLDNVNFASIANKNILKPYQAKNINQVEKSLWFDQNYSMTPFDYGYIGFVYDSKNISFDQPISLKDLALTKYKDKIIIEQPGLSSPGTQLLLWTKVALTSTEYDNFWSGLKNNVLSVAPDWGTAYYNLFIKGEAPIVLSYLTSPAYHLDQEDNSQYKAIVIKEGYIRQVEGIALIEGTKNQAKAQDFIDYVLSKKVQDKVATTQWMFPVMTSSSLPDAYDKIIIPNKDEVLSVKTEDLVNNFSSWLDDWDKMFSIK